MNLEITTRTFHYKSPWIKARSSDDFRRNKS